MFVPQRDAAPLQTPALYGRVVTAATGDAIRNARVGVSADRYVAPVLTDNTGRFAFADLPDRALTLTASKPGYSPALFHLAAAPHDPIVIALRPGTFSISALAPAAYYDAVVDPHAVEAVDREIENAEFLESLVAGAQRATLDEGQRVQPALRPPSR